MCGWIWVMEEEEEEDDEGELLLGRSFTWERRHGGACVAVAVVVVGATRHCC